MSSYNHKPTYAPDCPCINARKFMFAISDCETSLGNPGILTNALCYPLWYGSDNCRTWDNDLDRLCNGESPPGYCNESWCYVDLEKCMLSTEFVYKSVYTQSRDLYYSYSTCNSTAEHWDSFQALEVFKDVPELRITVPVSHFPNHYKLTAEGSSSEIAARSGPEYYNTSIPFEGAVIQYMHTTIVAADEIDRVTYVVRSKGSDTIYPLSEFTASVRDVQMGLSDLSVGTFWVTAERLKMSPFTTPVMIDKIFLAAKRPTVNNSFQYQMEKVLQPFSPELWLTLFGTLLVVAALSLWFSSPKATNKRPWMAFRNDEWKNGSYKRRCWILFRQLLEAFLQKGMFCFGAAVEQDFRASLPHKLLMFGFSFLVIVSVSAYVANLAAFLTLSGVSDYVDSMEKAIASGTRICAHPAIQGPLEVMWPNAKFVYNEETPGYYGLIESYDAGRCSVIAVGYVDTRYDYNFLEKFCERELAYTKGLIMDIPIAFPVRNELSAGISHYLFAGEKQQGLYLQRFLDQYEPELSCSVDIEAETSGNADELLPITIQYMVFPFFVLSLFAGIAIIIQICNRKNTETAAQFLSRRANLDEKVSEFLLDLARFAHLDAEYDAGLPLQDDDEEDSPSSNRMDILQYRKLNTRHLETTAMSSSRIFPRQSSEVRKRNSNIDPLNDDKFKLMLEDIVKKSVSSAIDG